MLLISSKIVDSKGRGRYRIGNLPATFEEIVRFNRGDDDVKRKFQKLASLTSGPESDGIVRATTEVIWNGGKTTARTPQTQYRKPTHKREGNPSEV